MHGKCVAAVGCTKTTATVSSLRQKSASLTGDRVKSMGIKLSAFLAKHDLTISLSDDPVDQLRSLFPKDEVLKNLTLGKQKATNIIRQDILDMVQVEDGTAYRFFLALKKAFAQLHISMSNI